ncbi:MAG: hypothetical protein E7585_07785 [Ruminococcaceae bacterium]|nr:hypothetical protein [Oscillospiraceae bacterium]
MKTKALCLILCALLLFPLLFTACGRHIEDTNGADTSLCALTEEELLSKTASYSSVGSLSSHVNGKQTLRVKKLSGVYAFNSYLAQSNSLTVTISTTLYAGNLRILLLCDGAHLADFTVNQAETLTLQNANGHRYEVRLAAESAKLDAEVAFTEE